MGFTWLQAMGSYLTAHRNPLRFSECINVPLCTAEARPGARRANAAKGRYRFVINGLVVDMDKAAGDALGKLHRLHYVSAEDANRQPIFSTTGQGSGFVKRGEAHHRSHRAKDFIGIGRAARRNIRQDGWPVEQALERAALSQASARLYARGDEAMYFIPLAFIDNRAKRNWLRRWIANRQALRGSGEALDIPIGDALVNQVTTSRHANLALVEK